MVDHSGKLLGILDMDLELLPPISVQEVVLLGKEGQGDRVVLVDERCTAPGNLPGSPVRTSQAPVEVGRMALR